jgi:transcriptional regulator with XRE-family HTH domain
MAEAGYTQRKLAKEMHMSKNTLNAKINGRSYFDTKQIDEICDILKITHDNDKILIFLAAPSQNRDSDKSA